MTLCGVQRVSTAFSKPLALAVLATLALGFAAAGTPSSSLAAPLPEGCNLDYRGQLLSAFVGHRSTLSFEMYNAVPPGHRIEDVRFSWGDGTHSRGTAATRSKPMSKGCYTTIFTGHHTYRHISCKNGLCSSSYKVTLRYRDAKTNAGHINNKLLVVVLRRDKKR